MAAGISKHETVIVQNDYNIIRILELIHQNKINQDKIGEKQLSSEEILEQAISIRPIGFYTKNRSGNITKYSRFGKFNLKEVEEILQSEEVNKKFKDLADEMITRFKSVKTEKQHFSVDKILEITFKDSDNKDAKEELEEILKEKLKEKFSEQGIKEFINNRFKKPDESILQNILKLDFSFLNPFSGNAENKQQEFKYPEEVINQFKKDAFIIFIANKNILEAKLMLELYPN